MESILIVGSSLAKQVLENSERCGKNIDSIIFKGKVNLNLVENALNITYIMVIINNTSVRSLGHIKVS